MCGARGSSGEVAEREPRGSIVGADLIHADVAWSSSLAAARAKMIPDEPGWDGPKIKGGGDLDKADLDVGGEDEESENGEQLAGAGGVGAVEQRGYCQA